MCDGITPEFSVRKRHKERSTSTKIVDVRSEIRSRDMGKAKHKLIIICKLSLSREMLHGVFLQSEDILINNCTLMAIINYYSQSCKWSEIQHPPRMF